MNGNPSFTFLGFNIGIVENKIETKKKNNGTP